MAEIKIEGVQTAQLVISVGNVKASVGIDKEKRPTAFNDGKVMDGDVIVATFSAYGANNVNINYNDTARIAEVSTAVMNYLSDIRENLPEMEITF